MTTNREDIDAYVIEALRAEVEQLRAHLAESEAENDQWQKKLADTWAEIEQTKRWSKLKLVMPDKELILSALDKLALALTEHHHQWTDAERSLYEKAISVCQTLEA